MISIIRRLALIVVALLAALPASAAQRYGDRVQEYLSIAPGTAAFTLGSPASGYVGFASIPAIASSDTVDYVAVDSTGINWEIGTGTYSSGSLARTTITSNSAGGTSAINFANPVYLSGGLSAVRFGGIVNGTGLPKATTASFGVIEPDGTTITVSGGVISAAGGGGSGTVNSGNAGSPAYYVSTGPAVGGWSSISYSASGTYSTSAINAAVASPVTATSNSWSISGTTLTIGGTITGTWVIGQELSGTSITQPLVITALGTGSGGAGTYTLNGGQTTGVTISTQTTTLTGTAPTSLAVAPAGAGALLAQTPTGLALGGNARGYFATDLQTGRTSAAQVASGLGSFAAGFGNTASGLGSFAGGWGSTASGSQSISIGGGTASNSSAIVLGNGSGAGLASITLGGATNVGRASVSIGSGSVSSDSSMAIGGAGYSTVSGIYSAAFGNANDRGRNATTVIGGYQSAPAQYAMVPALWVNTSSTSSARLTSDGLSASSANIDGLSATGTYTGAAVIFRLVVTARDTVTNDFATWYLTSPVVQTRAGAFTTTALSPSTPTFTAGPTSGGGSVSGASPPVLVVDNSATRAGLNLYWSPMNSDATHVVAFIDQQDIQ